MIIKTVVHFEIPANDVERLSKFYKDVFGWKFNSWKSNKSQMPDLDYRLISTGPEGKSVGGGMYKKMGPQDGPRNYIQVDKIDSAIATFKKAGGKEIIGKRELPNVGFIFIGADLEGNEIGLWEVMRPIRRKSTSERKSKR